MVEVSSNNNSRIRHYELVSKLHLVSQKLRVNNIACVDLCAVKMLLQILKLSLIGIHKDFIRISVSSQGHIKMTMTENAFEGGILLIASVFAPELG